MNQLKMQNKLRKEMENATYPSLVARGGAFFLDAVIFIPFLMVIVFLQTRFNKNENFIFVSSLIQIFSTFLASFYRIFFTKKFNGTPGKLICKFKILKDDGAPITWATAVKRELIVIFTGVMNLILFYAVFFYNFEIINTFFDASVFFSNSALSKISNFFMLAIFLLDYGKANASPKRQTMHDKIAHTVVVYKYVNL